MEEEGLKEVLFQITYLLEDISASIEDREVEMGWVWDTVEEIRGDIKKLNNK